MAVIVKLYPALFSKFKFSVPDADLVYSSILTAFGEKLGDIVVSSAFPFVEYKGEITFLLPFRLATGFELMGDTLEQYSENNYGFEKRIKKAKYFDPKIVADGKIDEDTLKFGVVSSKKLPKFISFDEEVHNTVDRGVGDTTYYSVKFMRFLVSKRVSSGLWLYYEGPEIDFRILRLGGEAGMGAGFIEKFEIVDLDKTPFTEGNILISALIPTMPVPDEFTFREKVRIFGDGENLKLRRIRVVEEGYVFKTKDPGKIETVNNKLVYGRGVYLGIENL